MPQQVFDYKLYIMGLFGRNRRVKGQSFELANDCPQKMEPAKVFELAEQKLAALKPRGSYSFTVSEWPCEIDGNMKSFMCFSDVTLKQEKREA